MPRRKKGPHLWFRQPRKDADGTFRPGQWLILDGSKQISTGCPESEIDEAERQLARYIEDKWRPSRRVRPIEQITVAEVLAIYDADKGDSQVNKRTYTSRMIRLNDWWGAHSLADVTGETCRKYAAGRGNSGGVRRDLEDLAAAITYHERQGYHRESVRVPLPAKGEPRDRWLTREEAARLIWACWRYREAQKRHRGPDKGKKLPTSKKPLRHVARFILLGIYTGTRAASIAAASPYRDEGRAWVDLDAGIFYRRPTGKRETNKRQPAVKLPPNLLSHMRRWKRTAINGHFVEFNGEPVKSVKTGFAHGVKLAALDGNITPHTLRHTAATWLMQNGADLWGAAQLLGMSVEMLQRVYGHHHPDFQAAAVAAFRPKKPANVSPKKPRDETRTQENEKAPEEPEDA